MGDKSEDDTVELGIRDTQPPLPPPPGPMCGDIEIIDLRDEQSDPSPHSARQKGRTVRRDPATITGIVVHQTACDFGVSRHALRKAEGDAELAQQRRALKVANHVMAYREGWIVVANEFDRYIYHGNGFNTRTLGLEIEGLYCGIKDNPDTKAIREDLRSTWRDKPQEATKLVIDTAREAIRFMVEEGRAAGMPIVNVFAHRQSSIYRRSDPGEELWRHVVVEYAVPELGLVVQPATVVGTGRPIPVEWDPNGVGRY